VSAVVISPPDVAALIMLAMIKLPLDI